LREIPAESITFAYCFEAAVHFDLEIILAYIKEFRRIMTPGAFGFVHHSNVTTNPGADFRTHPHWRNFMSKEIFVHLCIHNDLDVVNQYIFHQGGPKRIAFPYFGSPFETESRVARRRVQTPAPMSRDNISVSLLAAGVRRLKPKLLSGEPGRLRRARAPRGGGPPRPLLPARTRGSERNSRAGGAH